MSWRRSTISAVLGQHLDLCETAQAVHLVQAHRQVKASLAQVVMPAAFAHHRGRTIPEQRQEAQMVRRRLIADRNRLPAPRGRL